MLRPGGYATITEPERPVREADTFTCAHCNRIVHAARDGKPARPEDIGGLCMQCSGLICPRCVGKGCDPLEEKLRRWEAREIARRSYGF
jgi:hypothetical protein